MYPPITSKVRMSTEEKSKSEKTPNSISTIRTRSQNRTTSSYIWRVVTTKNNIECVCKKVQSSLSTNERIMNHIYIMYHRMNQSNYTKEELISN